MNPFYETKAVGCGAIAFCFLNVLSAERNNAYAD